jgi:glycosyltransferase involved in cell wall biosynthesis
MGGAEHSLLMLLEHLDRERISAHLACTGGPLEQHAQALGIPVHRVPLARLRRSPGAVTDGCKDARRLARLAHNTAAQALVANTVRAAWYAAPAARIAGIPFVWYMRDFWLSESLPRHEWLDRWAKRLLCAAAARVIVNSQATASHLPCKHKVATVFNGIDVQRFDPDQDGGPFRQQFNIPQDALVVGAVGRLRPWKGQDVFLRAMAPVVSQVPGVYLVVVGGNNFSVQDDYPQRLGQLAADLGLAEKVIFTGHMEDVRPALAAMDLFVTAGDPEPFGLVNVEAMAMGVPVVGFAHGALPEILAGGDTGQLVTPGDGAALGRAAAALLRDPERRQAMARAARRRVAAQFTIQRTTGEVTALLKEVLHP